MGTETWIVIGIVAIAVVYVIHVYNKLTSYQTQYENGFAQIETQLKRRHDLIPNLVNTAKGYLEHEASVLTEVTEARAAAEKAVEAAHDRPGNPETMDLLSRAESALNSGLGRLNATFEAYPDLKADANMRQLSEELATTENRVAYARQAYNDLVQKYNEYRRSFPPVMIGKLVGHGQDARLLEFEDSEAIQKAPEVSF
ncbi:LemA family protein [Guyparkeria hydrothermalis]|uniref:LemA family protein n=1 Tax=Guyparkeria halophila TaxID=47960 RepID=A0A6I6CX09_9GAMM|nr:MULTISPECIES: LemA family protein [Guyparkeria]MCL7750097.1 LemA family protein [Guyparkeria hydrothermalis]QGT78699.1 LemA family protein [Guyparkeria halophila]TKA89203.1 LemA family protein [Guyparkeria sp. SB14A]